MFFKDSADHNINHSMAVEMIYVILAFIGINVAASDDKLVHYLIKDDTNTSHLIAIQENKDKAKNNNLGLDCGIL